MPTPVLQALYEGRIEDAQRIAAQSVLNLPEAAALGDGPRCLDLLDAGATVDAPSPDGWPPLHLAAYFGHPAVVGLLLARGAAVRRHASSAQGNTALHAALAGRTSREVVRALLDADADVHATDAAAVRPVHLAAARGDIVSLASLVEHGARLDVTMPDGTTARDLAQQRGHHDAVAWIDAQPAERP
ncbi:MAG: ankyrin repeat domain-containing protein [Gemmatimonadetes bacterium]|nr:ankyrin repeat domain-containing protein [Gemmatimonadota bacterium]